MSAFQYQLPRVDRASWRWPRLRLEPLVVALGLVLPVPAFAATGMSIPMPTVVERLAAALVPWADAAVLPQEGDDRGIRGSIVQTKTERVTPAESPGSQVARVAPAPTTSRTIAVEQPRASRTPVRPAVAPASRSKHGERRPVKPRPRSVPAAAPTTADPATGPVTGDVPRPAPKAERNPRTPTRPAAAGPSSPRAPVVPAPAPAHTAVDTVTQTVDGVAEPVVTEVEAAEEKVVEKVDRVVVTVDKTAEKVDGNGEKVTHDVNVTVHKLPKLPGG